MSPLIVMPTFGGGEIHHVLSTKSDQCNFDNECNFDSWLKEVRLMISTSFIKIQSVMSELAHNKCPNQHG